MPAARVLGRRKTGAVALALASAVVAPVLITQAAAAEPEALVVSAYANRSAAQLLEGSTLVADAYVFLRTDTVYRDVEFLLDGRSVQLERSAPYDLEGGDASLADPLVVRNLPTGTHKVEARMRSQSGTVVRKSSVFVIARTAPVPSPTASPTTAPTPTPTSPTAGPTVPTDGFDPRTYDFRGRTGRSSTAPLRQVTSSPTLKTAGQMLSDIQTPKDVTVLVGVDGAGVRQSLLGDSVRALTGGRAVVEQTTFRAAGNAVSGAAVVVRNSDISSTNDGVTPTGGARGVPSLIEYNRIWRDGTRSGDNHHDGIQLWQGGNVVIRRNWISGWHTSAILIKSDLVEQAGDGPIRNVVVEENYLANPTGYYSLYVRDGGKGRPRFVTVRNNVFGPGTPISSGGTPSDQAVFVRTEQARTDAIKAGNAKAAEWIVWSGNTDTSGKEITPPGGWLR